MRRDKNGEQVGPAIRRTPASSILRCGACVYRKDKLVKSGLQPQWDILCMHPRADELHDKCYPAGHAGFSRNGSVGVLIGYDHSDETPAWCPEIKRNRAE